MSKRFVKGTCIVLASTMAISLIIGGVSMFIH